MDRSFDLFCTMAPVKFIIIDPHGVAVDGEENILVADFNNYCL